MKKQQTNREYKSDVFAELFSTKEKQIELFNALEGTSFSMDTELIPVTLSDVLFSILKNDLAFIIGGRFIVLTEHQASINENMPLRMFLYLAREYEQLVLNRAIYNEKRVMIPTPELIVLYNGKKEYAKEQILKLSDSFLEEVPDFPVELKVKVININHEVNHEILEKCQTLKEYSLFISKIRNYEAMGILRNEAIRDSIMECIKENILTEFLTVNGSEVYNMLFTQFNMEDALLVRELEGKAEGKVEGKAEGILLFLKEYGTIPNAIKNLIYEKKDPECLDKWLKISARVKSIEEFEEEIKSDI